MIYSIKIPMGRAVKPSFLFLQINKRFIFRTCKRSVWLADTKAVQRTLRKPLANTPARAELRNTHRKAQGFPQASTHAKSPSRKGLR